MRGMKNAVGVLAVCALIGLGYQSARAADAPDCSEFDVDGTASQPLRSVSLPPAVGSCKVRMSNGFPLPDRNCTPGATNPTLTVEVLRDPAFTTRCVRDSATTAKDKAGTYKWYGTPHPADNQGVKQTCELDHLISLELGGADSLDNIWPQCGPDGVTLASRFFKQKDMVENYLAARVKDGSIKLEDAQQGIADDWTKFLDDAKAACKSGRCRFSE